MMPSEWAAWSTSQSWPSSRPARAGLSRRLRWSSESSVTPRMYSMMMHGPCGSFREASYRVTA
jgi:hypothetical protein